MMSNTYNPSSLSTPLGQTPFDPPTSTNQTQTINEGLLLPTPSINRQSYIHMQQAGKMPNQQHIGPFRETVDSRRAQGFDQQLRPARQKDIRFQRQQQGQIEALRQKHQSEMGRLQNRLANDRKHRQRQIEDARLERQRKREQLQAQQTAETTADIMPMTNDPGASSVTSKQPSTFIWQTSTKSIKPKQNQPRPANDYVRNDRRRDRIYHREPSSGEEFIDAGSPDRLHEEYNTEKLPPEERWQQQQISLLESSQVPEVTNIDEEDTEQLQNIAMIEIIDAEAATERNLQLLTAHERSEQIAFLPQQSHEPYP